MNLQLPIPAGSGFHDGERWTPAIGLEFLLTRTVALAKKRHGSAFDEKAFHREALDLGGMGLEPLRAALARL